MFLFNFAEYDPNPLLSLSKRKRRVSTTEEYKCNGTPVAIPQELYQDKSPDFEKENKDVNRPVDTYKEHKKLKKRKRDKMKEKFPDEDKKKKRKHKCIGENCKHKKHHKKHRKHKKHHHKDTLAQEKAIEEVATADVIEDAPAPAPVVNVAPINYEVQVVEEVEEFDNQDDDIGGLSSENDDDFPECDLAVIRPEDEVTMDDITEFKKKVPAQFEFSKWTEANRDDANPERCFRRNPRRSVTGRSLARAGAR